VNVDFNIKECAFSFNPQGNESIEEEYELRVPKQDQNKMRMRYLSKLSKEQVWLPPIKQPKAS
jgi:hypothetical protein